MRSTTLIENRDELAELERKRERDNVYLTQNTSVFEMFRYLSEHNFKTYRVDHSNKIPN